MPAQQGENDIVCKFHICREVHFVYTILVFIYVLNIIRNVYF